MSKKEIVYNLLFDALLEIRSDAYEHRAKVAFHLADLFHHIPKMLESCDGSEEDFQTILDSLLQRAEERKCERWIQMRLEKGDDPIEDEV